MDDSEIRQLDDLESSHFWYIARKLQLDRWFWRQGAHLKVLDLGSATGGNTLHISSLGHDVTSAEFSHMGVLIQKNKGIPVVQADARDLPFSDLTFHIVVCLDVIEHIVEDGLVASEIYRVLKPGGKFLVSVPEDPNLWSAHDVAVSHIKRYTKTDLINVVSESGLNVQNIWSTLTYLRPAIVLARRFSKGSSLEPMNPFFNYLLLQVCKIELSMPQTRMKGVTLWIDGHK